MSAYTEAILRIRAARAERDGAKSALYALEMRQLGLLRAQKKAERNEVSLSPGAARRKSELRSQIAAASAAVQRMIPELTALDELPAKLKELEEARRRLAAGLEDLRRQANALARDQEARRAALEGRTGKVEKRLQDLAQEIEAMRRRLREVPDRRGERLTERRRLETDIDAARRELAELGAKAATVPNRAREIEENRRAIAEAREVLGERDRTLRDLVLSLLEQRPEELIEEWVDQTPILLLPLRVETRFHDLGGKPQLWVRVFPDEIHVNTHERALVEREKTDGIAYWTALLAAADDTEKKDAWRKIADKYGPNRAAWVARTTKPLNWVGVDPPADEALSFPELPVTKPDTWTEAPHTRVLPDRFVLIGYRGGAEVVRALGSRVRDVVVLGPAPLAEEDQPSITRDAENRLEYGEDFRWLVDFELAVKEGLGFKVDLDPASAASGFDQLLVVGLKLSADESDGKLLIEELIDNHHYSRKGFSLVRQGTATNNTEDDDAGFDSQDFLHGRSYFVETGEPAFTPVADPARASDGQRLAEYLGIDYSTLAYVSNAGGADHAEAIAMNRALYAATLGYYLSAMLNEVLSSSVMDRLRELFTEYVTGRGPLAAIRVGRQPYGVLLTSAFPAWQSESKPKDGFFDGVKAVLSDLTLKWRTLKPRLAHLSKAGNAGDNLMNVLGLQPTSAEYHQRVGYSYDYLKNLDDFAWGGRYTEDVLRLFLEQMVGRHYLLGLGYDPKRANGTPKAVPLLLELVYRHYHTRLDPKNLIDGEPLSEERTIKPWHTALGKNYIDWLIEKASDVDALERQSFGPDVPRPTALLYMMLHNALLLEVQNSIHRLLGVYQIAADELTRSRKFMNLSAAPDVSSWEVFRAPAHRVLPNEASDRPLLEFVQFDRFARGAERDVGLNLRRAKDALGLLRGLPTARLERAFIEHVDTLNYRLDAWQTGLFEQRLRQQRALGVERQERRTGVYLGAYGYLEDVRPARAARVKLDETALPPELREGKDNLFLERDNGGYVHTPSLNHATAAAVLRNGYLTHATPEAREKLAVNLSSERVRRAKFLVDGIRNGQSLETLLGYLFERGLHDFTTRPENPVILNHLIPVFRSAFPIRRTRLPRSGHPSDPAETTLDFHVVNGLAFARVTSAFPYGIGDMPVLDATQIAAIQQEKRNIENSLDALRDVLTAESAYQLALGNFDRAAAVMQSISDGKLPPEIEVIRSSRGTELAFTNRVVVGLNPAEVANPWPDVNLARRALTEPALNHWLGALLGDPTTVRCFVQAVDAEGVVLRDAGDAPIEGPITLRDLGLQPLDFVAIISQRVESASFSELESRVRYAFARQKNLSDATLVKIQFGAIPGASLAERSFAEMLPLADALRRLLGGARPLHAGHFLTSSKTVVQVPDNPGNVDVAELETRTLGIRTDFDAAFAALDAALIDAEALQNEASSDALRDALIRVANAGMVHAFPDSARGFAEPELGLLFEQARSLQARYRALSAAWDAALAVVTHADTKPPEKIARLTEMAKSLLGGDFPLLPRFSILNLEEVTPANLHRDELLSHIRTVKQVPLPVDEWLHGVSLVRASVRTLESVRTLSYTLAGEAPPCSPMQLPFRENDTWLGVEFAAGTAILHDTLAIVQCSPQGFDPAAVQCGFVIDEWVEALPQKQEVTGITFNYNQPDSAPPQALLLAISPRREGRWTFQQLTETVLDTFERAKLRAIEPDLIETLPGIATLLPSTLAEFSTGRSSISLDYSLTIQAIVTQIQSIALASDL